MPWRKTPAIKQKAQGDCRGEKTAIKQIAQGDCRGKKAIHQKTQGDFCGEKQQQGNNKYEVIAVEKNSSKETAFTR